MADSLLRVAMAASNNGYHTKLTDSAASAAIPATTMTATPMNTVVYDPMSMNSTAGAVGSITCKVDGYYIAAMRTSYSGVIDGTILLSDIWVNRQGAGMAETVRGYYICSGGVQVAILPACALLKLLAGDAVEGVIYTTTGASTTAAVATLNTIELVFVGPA